MYCTACPDISLPKLSGTKYTESADNGLTVDDQNKPILPVTVKADEKNVMLSNKRFLRPAEAWHAIGVLKPPVWTTKQGANYITWPKFGKYGKVMGKKLAHLTDLDKVRQLNQSHLTDKMKVCNRAAIDTTAKEYRIIKPAANVNESVATLPMEAVGIKGGPKFPAPTVPDVSGDNWRCLDIFLSSIISLFFLPLSERRPDID